MSKRYHDFPYHPCNCKRQKRCLTSASRFSTGTSAEWKFDVFMNFRGEDVRENFADCLFDALDKEGIYTFKDDQTFDVGKDLSKILKAIEKSRLSIIIFSKNYADSTFCLDETVKIVERMDLKKHTAFPVFLTVSDSDVRDTSEGKFKEAFDLHKQKFEEEKVKRWKAALERLANTCGFPRGGRKRFVELIEDIVYETLRKLNKIVSKIQQSCLKKGSELSNEYEGSRLIANVRGANERGRQVVPEQLLLVLDATNLSIHDVVLDATNLSIHDVVKRIILHMKLLCRKQKFDFLDDADYCLDQLCNLASDHPWFGSRSKIILTTRYKHVLTNPKIDKIHKVEPLNDYTTRELFRVSISIPSITIVEAANKSRVDFESLGYVTDHYVLLRGASICIHDKFGIDGAKISNSEVIVCEIRATFCKRIHPNHSLSIGGIEEESGGNHDSVEPITKPSVDDSGYNMKDEGGNSDMRGSQFQGFRGMFRGRNGGIGGRFYNNTRPTCQLCGKVGHFAATCYYRFDQTFNNNSGRMQTQPLQGNLAHQVKYVQDAPYHSRNNNASAMIATPSSVADSRWHMDSGATSHITSNFNNLSINNEYKGHESLAEGCCCIATIVRFFKCLCCCGMK